MLTRILLRWSNWPIPTPSDDLLAVTKPASFPTARIAADSLALTVLWAFLAVLGVILMFLLSLLGQTQSDQLRRFGGDVGVLVAWTSVAGLTLHATRYLIARAVSRSVEGEYFREHLRTSGQAQAMGGAVEMIRRPGVEALTRPRDFDLVIQLVLGILIFQSQHF